MNRLVEVKELTIIEAIPSIFGRLVYLGVMWDPAGRRYRFDPRGQAASQDEINILLGHAHRSIFVEWLSLSLERQRRDLMRFADSDGQGSYECLWSWWSEGFFDQLAPAFADRHETGLFRN